VLPVDFYITLKGNLTSTTDSLWNHFSVQNKCVPPNGTKLLCIPAIEGGHFFVLVVNFMSHTIEILDSIESTPNANKYLESVSAITYYFNTKLPSSSYTYSVRPGLPQQENGSDCGVFTCRYIYELVHRGNFQFETDTSQIRQWLAQYILDQAMAQMSSDSVTIVESTGLNTTSGVSYLCKYCCVSIPDIFYDKHTLHCSSNEYVIRPRAVARNRHDNVASVEQKLKSGVIDLTGSGDSSSSGNKECIDLTCSSPMLSPTSDSTYSDHSSVSSVIAIQGFNTGELNPGNDKAASQTESWDNNMATSPSSNSLCTPPPSPVLDKTVLDAELGLVEKDWEIKYRESWDPYSGLENPRFHMYEVDLHNVQEETGASACDESDCMFTLAYARQFVIDNLECIRKICRGEIITPFWKSFSEFTGIPLGAVAVADCDYFIQYNRKVSLYYYIIPFQRKQMYVYSELCHYLEHISWDEDPCKTKAYHTQKVWAVIYLSVALLMISDKLKISHAEAYIKMQSLDQFMALLHQATKKPGDSEPIVLSDGD
jgi:hypothetical protein